MLPGGRVSGRAATPGNSMTRGLVLLVLLVSGCDPRRALQDAKEQATLRYTTRNRPKCRGDSDCKDPALCPSEMTGWCGGYRGGASVQGYCSCTPLRFMPNPDGGAPALSLCEPNPDGGAPICTLAEDAETYVGADGRVIILRDAGAR